MWLIMAAASAVFAALTSILAKIGIEGVNSNVATFFRTAVVLVMALLVVFVSGNGRGLLTVGRRSMVFLVLSGLATGASWLCYYRALQVGAASRVAPIDKLSTVLTVILAFLILGERVSIKALVGLVLLTVGTVLIAT